MNTKAELLKHGFATIKYPPHITVLVREMMKSWQDFCALPLETKKQFLCTSELGTGYEFKDEIGATKDRKENFHLNIKDLPLTKEICRKAGVDLRFADSAGRLLWSIQDTICRFARSVEDEFDLAGLTEELMASQDSWFLRLLHYPPGSPVGKVIAAHHVDKLGITMYLGETTPGVQYYNRDGQWVDMPVLTGKTIITPNMQMQLKTRGEVKALYHRAVANEESKVNGRYSMVCFADLLQTPMYDKTKHGRIQDLPLGFNQRLSHEEFAQYFV